MSDKTKTDDKAPAMATAPSAQQQAPIIVSATEYRNQLRAEAIRKGQEQTLDETAPGGKYLLADGETYVDADGKPLKGDKE